MKRITAWLCLLPTITLLGYMFYVADQIERQSQIDESQPADVILVMGAAEYRGHPSPVLQQRLNHALLLYLKHLAPYILTTGGSGGDPQFTEGEVARAGAWGDSGRRRLVRHERPVGGVEAINVDLISP